MKIAYLNGMNILALETSTEYCSVALWRDGKLTSRCERVGQKHSERLMPMLDDVLREADTKLAALNGIAFGAGPGSFTGVRIACGAAQGLALGANLPVVSICTLLAMAEASGRGKVIAALDARMGEVYHAAYEKREGVWLTVVEPCLCKPGDAPQVTGFDWHGLGSGFSAHQEALTHRYAGQLASCDGTAIPQAIDIACLATTEFAAERGMDATLAAPLYLRDKVALTIAERLAQGGTA